MVTSLMLLNFPTPVAHPECRPVTTREEYYALGKQCLLKHSGTVDFDEHGHVPKVVKEKEPAYGGAGVLGHGGGLPYHQEIPRSERKYKRIAKAKSIDSETWRSMNRMEREGYVEPELRESELKAMSKDDHRDDAVVRSSMMMGMSCLLSLSRRTAGSGIIRTDEV